MPRYALKIEYDGAPFSGWQRQVDHPTVQAAIETALARLEPDVATIAAAGRTDTGVHGLGQVAHCDMVKDWETYRLSEALNYHLKPLPVAVVDAAKVADSFHARFSAIGRSYLFRVICRRAPVTHLKGYVWQVPQPLNVNAMREAATHLLGNHDFTTFRATQCQAKSPIKTLDALDITEIDSELGAEIRFHIRARSFLHNQVRSFIGTLERVGTGSWSPINVRTALNAKDRAACGPVAPPHGLYLQKVSYPNDPFENA